jgi:hypothetical protein
MLTSSVSSCVADSRLKAYGEVKYRNFRDWFDRWLDAAIEAAEKSELDSKLPHSKYVDASACSLHADCVCTVSENFVFCGVHM